MRAPAMIFSEEYALEGLCLVVWGSVTGRWSQSSVWGFCRKLVDGNLSRGDAGKKYKEPYYFRTGDGNRARRTPGAVAGNVRCLRRS